MTSLATGGSRTVPVYLLAGAPVLQQPRAGQDSGDPSLATEILPGPPQVSSVKQTAARRDSKKYAPLVSFLPQHDPGTSYAGMAAAPVTGTGILEANLEVDGPRRKRARVDKGCVMLVQSSVSFVCRATADDAFATLIILWGLFVSSSTIFHGEPLPVRSNPSCVTHDVLLDEQTSWSTSSAGVCTQSQRRRPWCGHCRRQR